MKKDTQRYRKEGDVTREAEIEVVLPQANECLKPPEAKQGRRDS